MLIFLDFVSRNTDRGIRRNTDYFGIVSIIVRCEEGIHSRSAFPSHSSFLSIDYPKSFKSKTFFNHNIEQKEAPDNALGGQSQGRAGG